MNKYVSVAVASPLRHCELNKSVKQPANQSLVRPKLEYLRKDIDLLEKVQKRATRLMIKDRNLSYSERLNRLNITTLETGRLRGDLIQVF